MYIRYVDNKGTGRHPLIERVFPRGPVGSPILETLSCTFMSSIFSPRSTETVEHVVQRDKPLDIFLFQLVLDVVSSQFAPFVPTADLAKHAGVDLADIAEKAADSALADIQTFCDIYSIIYSPSRVYCVYAFARSVWQLKKLFPNARDSSIRICPPVVHKTLFQDEDTRGVGPGSWCVTDLVDVHGRSFTAIGIVESYFPEQRVSRLLVPACRRSMDRTYLNAGICCSMEHSSSRYNTAPIHHDVRVHGLEPLARKRFGLDAIGIPFGHLQGTKCAPPPNLLSLFKAYLQSSQPDLWAKAYEELQRFDATALEGKTCKVVRGSLAGCIVEVIEVVNDYEVRVAVDRLNLHRQLDMFACDLTLPYEAGDEVQALSSPLRNSARDASIDSTTAVWITSYISRVDARHVSYFYPYFCPVYDSFLPYRPNARTVYVLPRPTMRVVYSEAPSHCRRVSSFLDIERETDFPVRRSIVVRIYDHRPYELEKALVVQCTRISRDQTSCLTCNTAEYLCASSQLYLKARDESVREANIRVHEGGPFLRYIDFDRIARQRDVEEIQNFKDRVRPLIRPNCWTLIEVIAWGVVDGDVQYTIEDSMPCPTPGTRAI
ncbi:hypothetical protein NMY22_g14513 [Coprinellus aureogranulatus]|nr:hypothetical protein NMY22_g14513 [Coprinellus aureogranulatus]